MRFFTGPQRPEESLLWSRDISFVYRLAQVVMGGRLLELESGVCLIAPAAELTDGRAVAVGRESHSPEFGLVHVDSSIPEADRYLVALAAAVQQSGIADRIGMGQSLAVAQTKMLDLFFILARHRVVFQPIVDLATGEVHEYECLFRPEMPTLETSIATMVEAAISTGRAVELDRFIVAKVLERIAAVEKERTGTGRAPGYSINFSPSSLLSPSFSASALAEMAAAHGIPRRRITVECTEQQAVSDVLPLARQVRALRKLGFGFAVDDAGAGYASFTLVAALRPSIIKIDREIIHGIGGQKGDAKRALVEAFVSFGRRIGARLVAEGIETRRELGMLRSLGVEFGQGYLLGRPTDDPLPARSVDALLAGPRRVTRPSAGTASTGARLMGSVRSSAAVRLPARR
jgi:EAL domain-containing protein (putative c-di-GMP-specific phosphodiesterase class I)